MELMIAEKSFTDSSGQESVLGRHPKFRDCHCIGWQEDGGAFFYYWSIDPNPRPDLWQEAHEEENPRLYYPSRRVYPPRYIGSGLDIVLGNGTQEMAFGVMFIRPKFIRYGEVLPSDYSVMADPPANDYSKRTDLSGIGRYSWNPTYSLIEITHDPKITEPARILYAQKGDLVNRALVLLEAQKLHTRKLPPRYEDFLGM